MLHHARTQWPVGQGLFHTGALWFGRGTAQPDFDEQEFYRNADLVYVYDCGAKTKAYNEKLKKCISDFASMCNRKIDVLFISHIHEDHVSGIDELSRHLAIDTVILPYFDGLDLSLAVGKSLFEGIQDYDDVWQVFRSFASDPITYFSQRDISRVILLGTPGQGDVQPSSFPTSPEDLPNLSPPDDRAVADDNSSNLQVIWNHLHTEPHGDGDYGIEVLHAPKSGPIYITRRDVFQILWLFLPYINLKTDERKISLKLFLEAGETIFGHGFTQEAELSKERLTILTDDWKSLKQLYKDGIKSQKKQGDMLNRTSISVYSGFMANNKIPHYSIPCFSSKGNNYICPFRYCNRFEETSLHGGWIGTGDAELRNKTDYTPFINYYHELFPAVTTITLPHHGSGYNYSDYLTQTIRPLIDVASADYCGNYKHPSTEVLSRLDSRNVNWFVVNSQARSKLSEFYSYELP